MEDYIQFSAKTKNEAITKACIELGASSDQLDIQVVSEGSSGFFGIGSKPAVIRVKKIESTSTEEDELKEIVETVKVEAIKEGEFLKKTSRPAAKAGKAQEPKEAKPAKEPGEPKENRAGREGKPGKGPKERQSRPSKDKPYKDRPAKERPPREKQPREEKVREAQPADGKLREEKPAEEQQSRNMMPGETGAKAKAPKEKPAKEKLVKTAKPEEIITDPEEIKRIEERAAVFLRDVFASMSLEEVEITSRYNTTDGCLEVAFEGDDMGILIGKRGQTLDSLQYLTSLVVNKGKGNYIRVKLDTEDYRRRRKETLENLARGIAYKVKKTRRPVILEPMNPYERRIIHSALQGNKFVETISEGEEPYRHVVVKMKKY